MGGGATVGKRKFGCHDPFLHTWMISIAVTLALYISLWAACSLCRPFLGLVSNPPPPPPSSIEEEDSIFYSLWSTRGKSKNKEPKKFRGGEKDRLHIGKENEMIPKMWVILMEFGFSSFSTSTELVEQSCWPRKELTGFVLLVGLASFGSVDLIKSGRSSSTFEPKEKRDAFNQRQGVRNQSTLVRLLAHP